MSVRENPGEFTLAAAVNRYFDVLLYLLIFSGFGTLASTGTLDLPTVTFVTIALLYRGYILARRKEVILSERWTNLLTIGCVVFFLADEFLISRTFISAAVHLVLFVMLVRLFSAQSDRDHYLLAVLAFLMVLSAAVLTVDSTFLFALGGFVLVGIATFVLMEMAHSSKHAAVQARDPNVHHAYRKLSFTIAGIAPLLLLLIFLGATVIFFLLPRVSAGYLSAYTGSNELSTGFSDRVELGRIGQIQQSKTVVLHVKVDDDTAGAFSLKLRGVALDKFDGHSWENTHSKWTLMRGADGRFELQSQAKNVPGRAMNYHVMMEPLLSNVFFLVAKPEWVQGNYKVVSQDSAGDVFDLDLEHPITQYEARSELPVPRRFKGTELNPYQADALNGYLRLPELDPRIKPMAEQITVRAGSPAEKAAAIENYLRAHYGYTLQLPRSAPRDPLANFLFERRQGHCEYFASAMAVMLRSVGIPSRVVNGFAGGEFNDITSQYVIRASDAHSWVEAYLPDQGWTEFDPTPAAATTVQTRWSRFLLYVDAMSSFWREWVVNYDLGHQLRLTQDASRGSRALAGKAQAWGREEYEKLLEWARRTQQRIGSSALKWAARGLALVLALLFAAALPRLTAIVRRLQLARRPQKSPQMAASIWYEKMLRQIARRGFQKQPSQTPQEFAAGIHDEQFRSRVIAFTEKYEGARFGKSTADVTELPVLYEEIKRKPRDQAAVR